MHRRDAEREPFVADACEADVAQHAREAVRVRKSLDRITLADLLQNEGRVVELVRSRLAEAAMPPPINLIALTPILKN